MNTRDLYGGLLAAAAGLLTMAGTAAAGLLLLDAGRIGELPKLTAAVVALAVGATADITARPTTGLPLALQGGVHVMPLGVSLAGAVVLGALLLRRAKEGLLVRSLTALVALPAGLTAVAFLARGPLTFQLPTSGWTARGATGTAICAPNAATQPSGAPTQLPDVPLRSGSGGLEAGFSVAVGQVALGAAGFVLVVGAGCWLLTRCHFRARRLGVGIVGAIATVCVVASWIVGGAAAAGGVLLALPLALFGFLLLGLGVPWTFASEGLLNCAGDPSSPSVLTAVSVALLLAGGVAVALRTAGPTGPPLRRAAILAAQLALVTGVVLTGMALLVRLSAQIGIEAFFFEQTVLDAQVAANPLIALAVGLAGGALAGFAGRLLVDHRTSLSWRAWSERTR